MIQTRGSLRSLFPVSLYAGLLVAVLALLQPQAVRGVEGWSAVAIAQPLRFWTGFDLTAHRVGAERREAEQRDVARRVESLLRRLDRTAPARPGTVVDQRHLPTVRAVVERRGGVQGWPSRLVLDVRRDALADAAHLVTRGTALIGFLDPDPVPVRDARGRSDRWAGHAQVRLLHDPGAEGLPRRVPARLRVEDSDAPALAFLVEPASALDRLPLRCALFDDPYRAARLRRTDLEVETSGLADDPLGVVPQGLGLGSLEIYGYSDGGVAVPIGVYVRPHHQSASLSHVVLWTTRNVADEIRGLRAGAGSARRVALRLTRLPVPTDVRFRWMAALRDDGFESLPVGAAVVDGERLIGVLESTGPGFGMVAPFGQPGRIWSLVLDPGSADGRGIVEVQARGELRQGGQVMLRRIGDGELPAPGAEVFTAGAGPDEPPFLWVGRLVAVDGERFVVEHVEAAAVPRELDALLGGGLER